MCLRFSWSDWSAGSQPFWEWPQLTQTSHCDPKTLWQSITASHWLMIHAPIVETVWATSLHNLPLVGSLFSQKMKLRKIQWFCYGAGWGTVELAAVCADVTAKCFMGVDEKAEACANRLEKQADKMNLILEETKPIGFSRTAQVCLHGNVRRSPHFELAGLRNRAHRNNLLVFSCKEWTEERHASAQILLDPEMSHVKFEINWRVSEPLKFLAWPPTFDLSWSRKPWEI